MPKFSAKSKNALATAHPLLQRVMNAAIAEIDFSVLCGHRTEAEQMAAYEGGKSQLRWPRSKHNQIPSLAVDIVPYPVDWGDLERFKTLAAVVRRHWEAIPPMDRAGWWLEWGGNWTSFKDYPHWELRH
jgi:peptidoglycan L-alanyl-D-glutamate endopeptidase CwlK